ncbi:translation initiation factor IF-2-like [Cervus elaphus]|uniref:translation initiation factor IF-2-like n=1 Tax=Cervus canadensis TaxID=1574408 RepID=UPI001CA321C9|nr:translation initiation factor IF-2-like [Cervus canadensis]XP_043764811.1 translation initiation factor IF-2-like [Cervus elaphus]
MAQAISPLCRIPAGKLELIHSQPRSQVPPLGPPLRGRALCGPRPSPALGGAGELDRFSSCPDPAPAQLGPAPRARPPPRWPPAAVGGCARVSARQCPASGCAPGSSSSRRGFGGRRAPARPGSGSPRNITPSPGGAGAWPGGPRRGNRAAVPPGGATRWEEAASSDQTPRGEGRDHSWPKLGRREIGGPSRSLPKDPRSSSPPAARPGAFISPAPSSGPLHRDRRKFITKWAVSGPPSSAYTTVMVRSGRRHTSRGLTVSRLQSSPPLPPWPLQEPFPCSRKPLNQRRKAPQPTLVQIYLEARDESVGLQYTYVSGSNLEI